MPDHASLASFNLQDCSTILLTFNKTKLANTSNKETFRRDYNGRAIKEVIEIKINDTIYEFQEKIHVKIGIPPNFQILIHNEKRLQFDENFKSFTTILKALNARKEFSECYNIKILATSGHLYLKSETKKIPKAIILESVEVVKEKVKIDMKYATQLLIFGYMHEMFEWTNIPEDILNVCHNFYHKCASEDLISCTASLSFEM